MDGGGRNDNAGDPVEPTDAISTTSDTDDLEDLIQALDPTIAGKVCGSNSNNSSFNVGNHNPVLYKL